MLTPGGCGERVPDVLYARAAEHYDATALATLAVAIGQVNFFIPIALTGKPLPGVSMAKQWSAATATRGRLQAGLAQSRNEAKDRRFVGGGGLVTPGRDAPPRPGPRPLPGRAQAEARAMVPAVSVASISCRAVTKSSLNAVSEGSAS